MHTYALAQSCPAFDLHVHITTAMSGLKHQPGFQRKRGSAPPLAFGNLSFVRRVSSEFRLSFGKMNVSNLPVHPP